MLKIENPNDKKSVVIEGKLYSTENAEYLFTVEYGNYQAFVNHSSWWFHWYRTKKGNLFKVKKWAGGGGSYEITTSSMDEIKEAASYNPNMYLQLFGKVEEA